MTKDDFLKLDNDKLKDYLKNNGFPEKYTVEKVKEMIKSGEIKPLDLVEYLEGA